MKKYIKKAWAYFLMFSSIMFFMFSESFLVNHYWIERMIISSILYFLGFYYYFVIEARLAKYGRC